MAKRTLYRYGDKTGNSRQDFKTAMTASRKAAGRHRNLACGFSGAMITEAWMKSRVIFVNQADGFSILFSNRIAR